MACTIAAEDSETTNWHTTFPHEMTTLMGSSLFVKRLVAVAISNITYMRAIFPESAYGTRKLADLDLKILSESASCAGARQLTQWVKACFEALDYKYLRQIMLGIHTDPDERDNVIEAYTFQFSYTEDGATVTCNGQQIARSSSFDTQMTKKATSALLRTLIMITQTLEPLPNNCYLTIKLLYHDATPAEYEPEGFVPAKTDSFYFSGDPVSIRVGGISTPFHSIKLRVKADKKQLNMEEEEEEGPMPSGSIPIQSSGASENLTSHFREENMEDVKDTLSREGYMHNTDELICVDSSNNAALYHKSKEEKAEETHDVYCPCGSQQDEGLMILCKECNYWQHGVCFGVIEETDTSVNHVCSFCYKTRRGQWEPTDKVLYNLPDVDMKAFCLWRRALFSVSDMKVVCPSVLAKRLQTEKSVAVNIIHRMEEEGYVTTGSGKNKGKKCVNQSLIWKDGIPKYIKENTGVACDSKNASVEELNIKTKDLHISGAPKPSTAYQRYEGKNDKENNQPEQVKAKNSKSVMGVKQPAYHLRGQKRCSEIYQDSEESFSQEMGRLTRQKRKKASISKSGILLPCALD